MVENLTNHLDSSAPVDVIAGDVLEQLASSGPTSGMFMSNLSASMSGESSGGAPSPRALMVLEAFQFLLSLGLLAPATQAGTVFVTRKGKEVGTAAGLKTYLSQLKGNADQANQDAAAALASMTKRVEAELAEMKTQAGSDIAKAIEDARKEAGTILDLARKTAEGVSLKDVQNQFAAAGGECLKRIRVWASLSCVSVATLTLVLIGFMTRWAPPLLTAGSAVGTANSMYPAAIYQAIIRVTLLTAIGAVATFCFRVLRAQMHLREQNLHRERVANSVAAFLGAASSPEQRDVILARVVDAITVFGNSGLLSDSDESMSPAKLILENVPRVFSSKP